VLQDLLDDFRDQGRDALRDARIDARGLGRSLTAQRRARVIRVREPVCRRGGLFAGGTRVRLGHNRAGLGGRFAAPFIGLAPTLGLDCVDGALDIFEQRKHRQQLRVACRFAVGRGTGCRRRSRNCGLAKAPQKLIEHGTACGC
jgi:hypothetical protein